MKTTAKEAWIVLDGIQDFDIRETKEKAEASVDYDRNHGKSKAHTIPCTITYELSDEYVEREAIKNVIKELEKLI